MIRFKFYILCLSFLLPVCAPELYSQIVPVDPTAELRREGTFIDTARVELADETQLNRWLSKQKGTGFFCFTEHRNRELRFDDALPLSWLSRSPRKRADFCGYPQPGETFVWQIVVYAPYEPLTDVRLHFGDLTGRRGDKIPASAMECYRLGGTDKDGKRFTNRVNIPKGKLQPLWIGVDVPLTAKGVYRGEIILQAMNQPDVVIPVTLEVSGQPLADGGVEDAWRKSRIKWINSEIGRSQEPTAPYIPLTVRENTISYLGGEVSITPEGLPAKILTHYDCANRLDGSVANEVLADPVVFVVETDEGKESFKASAPEFTEKTAGTVGLKTKLTSENFEINCNVTMLFDGSLTCKLTVKALRKVNVKDIRAEFNLTRHASEYIMGLGRKGGKAPVEPFNWKWDTVKHQDQIWMGGINAGLNIHFKGENYKRPLVNIYYGFGPLQYPDSWGNSGKGGVRIEPLSETTRITAYSGSRTMEKGEESDYDFDLMITPVKPINFAGHFTDRFYHLNADTSGGFISEALKYGANLINLHHKSDIYPFLNYPMQDEIAPDLKKFIDRAHDSGLGVRPYYTCRELSVKTPEFWILRSLGNEILMDGPGNEARTLIHTDGPKPWLIENLRSGYIPGWYAAFEQGRFKGELDIAVIATPESRWSNYFLEGLDWMVKELKIDGIYIDDTSLDGETMRRGRRILDADGKRRLADMHTWNHMNEYAGYANSLQLYTHLLPYIDRLWIGEMFKADNPRDFWLVEMSGIPFGLMSETLDAHNIYRGFVFGMLPRLPWSGNPAPMWKLIDEFGMAEAEMIGYWDDRNPLQSSNEQIPATTYLRKESAMVVLANWNDADAESCRITIDTRKLGFTPTRVYLPEIDELQPAGTIDLNGVLEIPAAKGKIIILKR